MINDILQSVIRVNCTILGEKDDQQLTWTGSTVNISQSMIHVNCVHHLSWVEDDNQHFAVCGPCKL